MEYLLARLTHFLGWREAFGAQALVRCCARFAATDRQGSGFPANGQPRGLKWAFLQFRPWPSVVKPRLGFGNPMAVYSGLAVLIACGFAGLGQAQPGALDLNFAPVILSDGNISATAVQADGKIVVLGAFTVINGASRQGLARLNADGSVD